MKYGLYLFTLCTLAAFLLCGHYGYSSYTTARQLQAASENIAVRARLIKRQVGELEQKARVLNRVSEFVGRAEDQHLTPEDWSTYDVEIHDALAFEELSQIIEQCGHNRDIYFRPISFHVTVGHQEKNELADKFDDIESVPTIPNADDSQPSDVSLALKGTFLVRQ